MVTTTNRAAARNPLHRRAQAASAMLALLCAGAAGALDAADLRFRTVEGAGAVPLNVVEAGDASKPGILLIHGIGQSYLSFEKQLRSPLADEFHLVAFDLRAHGNSGKPWQPEAYQDTAIWAEDVRRVMDATGLQRPVLLGWSYGTLVSADYLRHVGTGNLSGVVLVGALGGLTAPPPTFDSPQTRELMARSRARQGSRDLEENMAAAVSTLSSLTGIPMPPDWRERTLMMMTMVPAYARPYLWLRNVDNRDVVAKIDVPLLLIGGSKDVSVDAGQARELAARVRQGSVSIYDGIGHSPFAEDPERFNRELGEFARRALAARAPR